MSIIISLIALGLVCTLVAERISSRRSEIRMLLMAVKADIAAIKTDLVVLQENTNRIVDLDPPGA
jgi:hypothetical protein